MPPPRLIKYQGVNMTIRHASIASGLPLNTIYSRLYKGRDPFIKSTGIAESNTRRATHGMESTAVYNTWRDMKQRCQNPNAQKYRSYGGRGISICEPWQEFESFYADMGDKPDGMSLDRIDNDGDYTPENCKWSTPQEQSNNTRANSLITYQGKTQSIANWARETGLTYHVLKHRHKRGWVGDMLFSTEDYRGKV